MSPTRRLLLGSDRVYRLLLAAYPPRFRQDYGAQMAQLFRDCCRDMYRERGTAGLLCLWGRTLGDLAVTAMKEHVGARSFLFKRLLDIAIALASLVLLAPLFVIVALLIKLDSRGPVFYRATIAGKNGAPFRKYKFRTMVAAAGPISPPVSGPPDARITRLGRLLRRTCLDELPQCINVLKGDMSLVGPRPAPPQEVDLADPVWRRLLSVRPGMTGPAQLVYTFGKADAQRRFDIDVRYIQSRSARLDLKLLAQTFCSLAGLLQADILSTAEANAFLTTKITKLRKITKRQ
jgi:lipopolysaccharide/colanic/teichoic acid biosynthesis glycosyltransferase